MRMLKNDIRMLVLIIFVIVTAEAVAATLLAAQQAHAAQPNQQQPNQPPSPPAMCSPESTYIGPPCEYRISILN